MEKGTFISSVTPYPEEEYYLSKSQWSATASDWDQRFEVGDVVADPSGSWEPSTAQAYIDQQVGILNTSIVSETIARQTGDRNLQTNLTSEMNTRASQDANLNALINAGIREGGGVQFDIVPTQNSANGITSGGMYNTLKDSTIGFVDDEPIQCSDNLVKSGGVENSIADIELELNGTYTTQNIRSQIVPNRNMTTEGNFSDGARSLLKVRLSGKPIKVQCVGIYMVRYGFYADEPNLHIDSANALTCVTLNQENPSLDVISGAEWVVFDISQSVTPANNVYAILTQDQKYITTLNPILKHQANQEIWWRGTARLFWNAQTRDLYWSEGTTGDSNGTMLLLSYKGRTINLSASVKSRKLSGLDGNVQLFLPVPSNDTTVYTLNDIIVQTNSYPYDENQYIKIAHLTYGNALSSFIIDSRQLDQKIDFVIEKIDVDNAALNPDFNYNSFVITDGSIEDTGILRTYYVPGERAAFFFKMPENKRPPVINGCAILALQWYSGFPDYIYGSNSLGRTTTNTPPENAKYCGITLYAINDHSNITVRPLFYDRDKIGLYGSYLNNSIGENCFANGVRTNLKILGYGNSFMRNSVHYLSVIAKGCGVNLTVGNLYTGGTQLGDHYNALLNNTNPYEWHKYVDGQNTVNQYNQTALRGLLDERWDAIILHQYTPWNNPFEPVFNRFIKLIIEKLGYCPKIYINATWAGSLDNNQTYYGFATEAEMWQAMLDYVRQACKDSGVAEFSIIPTGTAIQNARTLSWADSYHRFVNYVENETGHDLHHLNPAGGFIAACTVFEKIITPLNGIHCSDTTFRITTATSLPPQSDIQTGILVTDSNYLSLCQAAIDAVNDPYQITTL